MELKKYLFTAASVLAISASMAIAGPGDSSSSIGSKGGGSSSPAVEVSACASGPAPSTEVMEASESTPKLSFWAKAKNKAKALKAVMRMKEAQLEAFVMQYRPDLVNGDGKLSASELISIAISIVKAADDVTDSLVTMTTLADEALGTVGAGEALDDVRGLAERADRAVDDFQDDAAPAFAVGGAVAKAADDFAAGEGVDLDELSAAIESANQD